MSSGRYYTSIVFFILSLVGFTIVLTPSLEFWGALVISYVLAASIGTLIFWETLPAAVFRVIAGVAIIPISFAWNMLASGSVFGLILGLLILSPCLGFLGSALACAFGVLMVLSVVTYPIKVITSFGDTY